MELRRLRFAYWKKKKKEAEEEGKKETPISGLGLLVASILLIIVESFKDIK